MISQGKTFVLVTWGGKWKKIIGWRIDYLLTVPKITVIGHLPIIVQVIVENDMHWDTVYVDIAERSSVLGRVKGGENELFCS